MANTTATIVNVTNLSELTAAKGPFAGCAIIPATHTLKGDLKGRAYIALPFTKANLLGKLGKYANLEAVQTPTGFGIVLKGTGGRTAKEPADAFQTGYAELLATETRVALLRASLSLTDAQFGELMGRFNGTYAQRILAVLNRAETIGTGVTFDTIKPEPKPAKVPAK